MLTAKTQSLADKVTITLEGIANESLDLAGMLGPIVNDPANTGKPILVACANISRINSTAIKHWIHYFESSQAAGIPFYFIGVAPCLVEQLNRIANFGAHYPVLSAVLPYSCDACGKETFRAASKEEALATDLEVIEWPCPHCGEKSMQFDDLPEDYLRFWRRE